MFKKALALILALVCCFALLAGCGGGSTDETKSASKKNPALENYEIPDLEGVTISQYMPQNTDYDAQGTWLLGKVREYLNVDLQIYELDSFSNQYLTMLAEGNVPDLTWNNSYMSTYVQLGQDGAYINLYDYLDMMPNVAAFLEDPDNAHHVARYELEDGSLYALPSPMDGDTTPYAFLYRKDVFEKHGLTFPTTQDEFVAVLRKLKELYPDSQPFIMRNMTGNMNGAQTFAYLFGDGAGHVQQGNYGTIFNLGADGEYYMAQQSVAYKEMCQFFKDLTAEGLMHKSSMTVDTAGWMEAFASDTSFITYDKTDRIPAMNRTGQSLKADFLVSAAEPFNFGTYAETAEHVTTSRASGIGSGASYYFMIGDNENKENTMAYVDWMYSEDGWVVSNWGFEGVSWEWEDREAGTRKYIDGFIEANGGTRAQSGLGTPSLTGRRSYDAYVASLDENERDSLELAQQFRDLAPANHKLQFTEDEQFLYDTYGTACYNAALTEWSKFMLGQRDMSEWDQVVDELRAKYKYDELMEIHEAALARLVEKYGLTFEG